MMSMPTWSVDFFCHVYDNFGDAGFCYRLARQLTNEYNARVRLIIDDLHTLKKIESQVNTTLKTQVVRGIEIFYWTKDDFVDSATITIPDVVIEGIEAKLPGVYSQTIDYAKRPPIWFGIDYLLTEDWVERYHLSCTIGPVSPLRKICFFPGFVQKSGGLIREKNWIDERDRFLADPTQQNAFFKRINVSRQKAEKTIFLFCYDYAPVKKLFDFLRQDTNKVQCLVPIGVATETLTKYLGRMPYIGESVSFEQLTITIIPMINQIDFDYLLASCDFNFVRGEDSFIRAHWAGKPFIWQIYRQSDDIHLRKLNAYLDKMLAYVSQEQQAKIREFWSVWNEDKSFDFSFGAFWEVVSLLSQVQQDWVHNLLKQEDLATRLMQQIHYERQRENEK